MTKRIVLILLFCLTTHVHASTAQAYLDRFLAYLQWSQNLPAQPTPDFLAFIDNDTPLAQKLRDKWLYQLVRQKDWGTLTRHYKPSADTNLQCFAAIAHLNTGNFEKALTESKRLWLTGNSLPKTCDTLFDWMINTPGFDEKLLDQRLILALDNRNIALARYLLKQYKPQRTQDEQLLLAIYQNPQRINTLSPGKMHDSLYLFGLKQMINRNMDNAIIQWQNPLTKRFLNEAQQQAFLSQLTLFKAMRNHEDEPLWFAQIKPAFYTEALLDWQIRFALKGEQWDEVLRLINQFQDKDNPCWQYWLARALEAKGEKAKAHEIYQTLANTRNYYGFLASMRLNKKPNFENEAPVTQMALLAPYKPLIENIRLLYSSKQTLQASRLLNDFFSELPKDDQSALAYWLANTLQWHDKSVYLSNTKALTNQLSLRFPVIYQKSITHYAKNYHIPQELIYAIMRQESGFQENVVSPAGARGLMQIMPYTAGVVAKQEKITYQDKNQLFSSEKNINLGVAYLQQLAKRYHYHPVLVAAAYNGGPSQVNYWLKTHPPHEMDIWIDTLPWHETRNYLKNIIAFYAVYQYRLHQKWDLDSFMQPL
ncbi:MAG: transglycosylase SLT domain-containing protein [Tatlockia sp.]|jgi:soluble lytic murein transglycosylase